MRAYRSIAEANLLDVMLESPADVDFDLQGATPVQAWHLATRLSDKFGRCYGSGHSGFVYFIQRYSGPIKIGFSANPVARLSSLATSSHEDLFLIAAFSASPSDESGLHNFFSRQRLSGEWFRPSADLWQCIISSMANESLSRALLTFDLATDTSLLLQHWCAIAEDGAKQGRSSRVVIQNLMSVLVDALMECP